MKSKDVSLFLAWFLYSLTMASQAGDSLLFKYFNDWNFAAPQSIGSLGPLNNLFGVGKKDEPKSDNKITLVPASKAHPAQSNTHSGNAAAPSKIEITSEESPGPSLIDVVKTGDPEKVKESLADIHTLVNVQDQNGWSSLMYAVQLNQTAIVTMLLERGANVNIKDSSGWTPLHLASNGGNQTIFEALIANGSDVNAVTAKGTTPLMITSGRGYIARVQKLIACHALILFKDGEGKTALTYATEKKHRKIADILKKAGATD